MTKFLRALALSLLGCSVLCLPGVSAASRAPTGITLSPFLQQVTLGQDEESKDFNLTLSNHTSTLQEITLTAKDFGSLNDTGGVFIEGSNDYSQKYGLAAWLSLGSDTVDLQPGESKTVTVTVDNRESLQPGGHYGAIIATIGKLDDASAQKIVLNQQLLSLVLATKTGGEHYDLHLQKMAQNGNWLHLPDVVNLRFQNPGNVHVVPRGLVQLTNGKGTVLAQAIINEDSGFVLPESFRQMSLGLNRVNATYAWPGTYHLKVFYRYDGINQYATKTLTIRYVNLPLIGGIVVAALLGWALYRRTQNGRKTTSKTSEKSVQK